MASRASVLRLRCADFPKGGTILFRRSCFEWRDSFSMSGESRMGLDHATVSTHLNLDHGAQERHGLFHFRHGKATVKLFAFPSCAHEAGGLQDSQMLGQVRFGNTEPHL